VNYLTVVMYHYVRDLPRTRYPRLKGLPSSDFHGQLDYIQRHYRVVGLPEVVSAVRGEERLPANAVLLTFDDGYADHYETVVPALVDRGLTGVFFPPVSAVENGTVLLVNKIQFILAMTEIGDLLGSLLEALDRLREDDAYPPNEELFNQLAKPGRYDPAEVMFVKNALQKGLPHDVRQEVASSLFAKYVAADEAAFARELYVTTDQLKEMLRAGMYVGAHGVNHVWLGEMTAREQVEEVDGAVAFLSRIGVDEKDWAMCYPYGSYNPDLLDVLHDRRCALGFTTKPELARLTPGNALTLERLDTNDLPRAGDAAPVPWTRRVIA
jgi:peptidoglycan/xylan/chitin deacetylase (PgdA/CDA1 family)